MRVAFVLGTTSGGTGRHVGMLAEGLLRRGHQVLVVGPASVEEQFGFRAMGAAFAAVPISDRPHPLNDAKAALRIRRHLRGADVTHAHGLRAGALTALAGVRAPLVVTLHNALTAGGLVGAVYGTLERIVARRADRVLVVSPDLGDRMRALGAREVAAAVVPAPPVRAAARSEAAVREELGAGDRPLVLTIARLAQQKGLETLLDLAATFTPGAPPTSPSSDVPEADLVSPATGVSEAGPSSPSSGVSRAGAASSVTGASEVTAARDRARAGSGGGDAEPPLFVVAGEGPLRQALQARIEVEKLPVLLLGNRDDIPNLLAAATLVLWPSRWEGQPLSLSEALMAGKPVVATEVGGIPDLMGGAGVLVPYGDLEAIGAAVRELIDDSGARRRLADAARERGARLPGAADAVEAALAAYQRRARPAKG
ncbi:glycosyltransferase family 4 protein [Nonomuraea sp. NPDC049152]|uniref:glycosyltransferase family 4 protein n=1 Tax=Nonomuraea sp. NPDC049152 TaxID=3154350 RepID=UPI0034006911